MGLLTASAVKTLKVQKFKMADGRHVENSLIAISSQQRLHSVRHLVLDSTALSVLLGGEVAHRTSPLSDFTARNMMTSYDVE